MTQNINPIHFNSIRELVELFVGVLKSNQENVKKLFFLLLGMSLFVASTLELGILIFYFILFHFVTL